MKLLFSVAQIGYCRGEDDQARAQSDGLAHHSEMQRGPLQDVPVSNDGRSEEFAVERGGNDDE
jgi:hypothetical protein